MKNKIFTVIFICLFPICANAQLQFGVGGYYSQYAGPGIGIGLLNVRKDNFSISYFGLSAHSKAMFKQKENYSGTVNAGEFSSDIVNVSDGYRVVDAEIGMKMSKQFFLIGVVGYGEHIKIQDRDDPTNTLGNNGDYYIIHKVGGEIDIGVSVLFILPLSTNRFFLAPRAGYTKVRGLTGGLGFYF